MTDRNCEQQLARKVSCVPGTEPALGRCSCEIKRTQSIWIFNQIRVWENVLLGCPDAYHHQCRKDTVTPVLGLSAVWSYLHIGISFYFLWYILILQKDFFSFTADNNCKQLLHSFTFHIFINVLSSLCFTFAVTNSLLNFSVISSCLKVYSVVKTNHDQLRQLHSVGASVHQPSNNVEILLLQGAALLLNLSFSLFEQFNTH